ncbi:MAG: sodium/glutamate symporter [Rubripirellula sp.]|jgi:ESS family glutamate:Na+ symporter
MIPAVIFVAILLLIGVGLRLRFTIFRWFYIPASVVAGMIGLMITQIDFSATITSHTTAWTETLASWPGFLIAVIFGGMLLERKPAPWRKSISRVGRQGLMVWVIVLGETAIGLIATWLLIKPFFDVPHSFGTLIETGFAGGHGTAAAMGQVFRHPTIQLDSGLDLGILMATCGLLYGLISGIFWINIAVRRGWIGKQGTNTKNINSENCDPENNDSCAPKARPVIGYARIGKETIDPLLLQVLWLAIAFGIGLGLQSIVTSSIGFIENFGDVTTTVVQGEEQLSERLTLESIAGSFPLFIYTLFGGWIVRTTLNLLGYENAIDRETINRLTSTAMDILIVSAITTLNIAAVTTLIIPFAILFLFGAAWTGFCLMVLARKMLPREHWFELGLINYGMSTGTTATGFVLLRLVDPELESGAAEDYALAAPLSSPFIGGGMITVALPLLILERVPIPVTAITMTLLVVALIYIGQRWNCHASGTHQNEDNDAE